MSEEPPIADERLVRQSQAGSLEAFEELVRRYEQRIYAFVANCCRNSSDADEITQDTFVRAYRAIAKFDSRRNFAPWLFAIARRRCIDHFRANPARPEEPAIELFDTDDPAELMARREDGQGLWQLARSCLSQPQFLALWLRYAEEMDVNDIARALGKTQTHTKVVLFRARRTLGRALGSSAALQRKTPAGALASQASGRKLKVEGKSPPDGRTCNMQPGTCNNSEGHALLLTHVAGRKIYEKMVYKV
jgi:RNA polymerase sigma-70 factor (ECF subfamily)